MKQFFEDKVGPIERVFVWDHSFRCASTRQCCYNFFHFIILLYALWLLFV